MTSGHAASLAQRFADIRAATVSLCAPLATEDYVVQSMPDASPAKWHLAHTTWFFEQFVLAPHAPGYRVFDEQFAYLFNSYYETVGPRHRRPERGLLTRPTVAEVRAYRDHVDQHLDRLLQIRGARPEVETLIELGLHHEQQHQELMLMDLKHLFSCNPLKPVYREESPHPSPLPGGEAEDGPHRSPLRFHSWPEGIYEIGHGGDGFCFDNETPRHRVFLSGFELAHRLTTNAEYLDFVRDGGYQRPELWVSDGWSTVQSQDWTQPLYWSDSLDSEFTLAGMRALDPDAPVSHVSWYEADAFARWTHARLPTEAEWEVVASRESIAQLFDDLWQWTSSAHSPYPGFRPLMGALGEYNAKFMANQFVLRGGSCATPESHIRTTYRNFFYPHMRWQFAGIRLAKDSA